MKMEQIDKQEMKRDGKTKLVEVIMQKSSRWRRNNKSKTEAEGIRRDFKNKRKLNWKQ